MAREVSGNRAQLTGKLRPLTDPIAHFKNKKTAQPFDIILNSLRAENAARELLKITGNPTVPKSILERTT